MPKTTTPKSCEVCGAAYGAQPSQAHKRRTCSRECYATLRSQKYADPRGITITAACAHCGKPVRRRYGPAQAQRPTVTGIVYCGRECHKQHRQARVEHVTLTCDRCGRSFQREAKRAEARSKRGTYCSRECFDARVERECEQCGTTFHVPHGDLNTRPSRFCSRACLYQGTASQWESHSVYLRHKRMQDPERFRAYVRNRRAQKKAAGRHTAQEFQAKLRAHRGRCHWCGKKIHGTPHADHVIALSRGGSNLIGNVVPSCSSCNHTKGAKLPWEFSEGRLL